VYIQLSNSIRVNDSISNFSMELYKRMDDGQTQASLVDGVQYTLLFLKSLVTPSSDTQEESDSDTTTSSIQKFNETFRRAAG